MAEDLSCGVRFMRGLLLVFNILFVILGLALIGVGIYAKVNNNFASILAELAKESKFEAQSFGFLSFVVIGGGVFTLLIALFGCMGTLWASRCLLYTYALILGILMVIELVGFIMAFAYKGKVTDVYETALSEAFNTAVKANNTNFIGAFHNLENAMECCGVHSRSDYDQFNNTQYSTWCKDHATSKGCSKAIIDFLDKNLPAIGITLGVLLAVELVGLLAAIILAVALKHTEGESYSSHPGEVLQGIVPGRRGNYYK